ncbi:condensation domain-containing protein [Streptomyces longispororuber]|uniref:condensation domain-containing protein n=1 Tax=Streptomyces longispororuber TaxID=68230 RepID=UPI0036FCD5CE
MSDNRTAAHRPLNAVLHPGTPAGTHTSQARPPTLDLHGLLDPVLLEAALAHLATAAPGARTRPHIRRHGPAHHTLSLEGGYPLGALADLLSTPHPAPDRANWPHLPQYSEPTALQQHLLADIAAHPHHQVAQLTWRWHGPLDTARFTAAWQAVFDRESVLRTAIVPGPGLRPRLAVHAHARPAVQRHPHTALTRQALAEHERRHGFDPTRPGLLRAALLDGAPQPPAAGHGPTAPTEVLLTYHRALLDAWSVRVLLRAFYRAYLTGTLPGGERRPDLRDYQRWLTAQDTRAAQDLWTTRTPPPAPSAPPAPGPALARPAPPAARGPRAPGPGRRPARPAAGPARQRTGRTRARLTRAEAARLTTWAARQGVGDSTVLHAVWAMLLHHIHHPGRRGPVRFAITFPGRTIALENITRIPGPFATALPLSVDLDPATTVRALLHQIRDQNLDTAAYEWLSPAQIQQWTQHPAPATVLTFEPQQRAGEDLAARLAAHGIRVEEPEATAEPTAHPLSVLARHDHLGCLVLTAAHDRRHLHDDQAAALLAHTARLLRHLPLTATKNTTVAQVLAHLSPAPRTPAPHGPRATGCLPRLAPAPTPAPRLEALRPARHPDAATLCLITTPGTPHHCHTDLLHHYSGPQALTALHPGTATLTQCLHALRAHTGEHPEVALAAYFGAGALAYDLARHLRAPGRRPPLVVLGAGCRPGTERPCEQAVGDLAQALATALATRPPA